MRESMPAGIIWMHPSIRCILPPLGKSHWHHAGTARRLITRCAVAALVPKTTPTSTDPGPSHTWRPNIKGKRPAPYPLQRPVCMSWNAGSCRFPGKCGYAHICTICEGPHPAVYCRDPRVHMTAQKGPGEAPQKRGPPGGPLSG